VAKLRKLIIVLLCKKCGGKMKIIKETNNVAIKIELE
jgi:hypothetical protein